MRYCIFSDIHGNSYNLESFFSVTAALNIDKYICLGDLCNYYPDSLNVIDQLIEKKVICTLGNHVEIYVKSISLTNERKTEYNFNEELLNSNEHLFFLKSLPTSLEIISRDVKYFFCHGSPNNLLNGYIYPDSDLYKFSAFNFDVLFCGHTHRQFIKQIGNKIICNVGSIGLPRDVGSLYGFVILDDENGCINLYRKQVDVSIVKSIYQDKVPQKVIDMLNRRESIQDDFILV